MIQTPKKHLAILILPAAAVIFVFAIVPVGWVITHAFMHLDPATGKTAFAGLENFRDLFSDWFFVSSIKTTVKFSLIASFLQVGLGLSLALLFNRKFAGRRFALPVIIYPMMLSTLVASSVWRAWFHYDFGMLNHWLSMAGLPSVKWLFDPKLALYSIILVDVWQWTPMTFLIVLAGLQSIPKDVLEAAVMDNVSPARRTVFVILPMIRGHIFLALLVRSIDTFRLFDKVYALTGGGPGNATETLSMFVYRHGFKFFEVGTASAASIVMLAIACALSLLYATRILKGQHQ